MYKAFSQILADGRKVTSLNVLAINKKLINKEVDAASSPLQERITPLMSPLSKERAQSGPLGQLKDGTHIASLSEDELKIWSSLPSPLCLGQLTTVLRTS